MKSSDSNLKKVSWFVPKWAYRGPLKRSFDEIIHRGTFVRITLGSLVACSIIMAACKIAFPLIVLPKLWQIMLPIAAFQAMLPFQIGILFLIPPQVCVHRKKIVRSHGQTGQMIKSRDVLAASIYVHQADRIRLKIRYRGRRRTRTLVVGVADGVDLEQLATLLPVEPTVRDARARGRVCFGAAQETSESQLTRFPKTSVCVS